MSKIEQIGVIIKIIQSNTIVVRVKREFSHPVYSKRITRTKNYLVHDQYNIGKLGDRVRINKTRPLSRKKHWKLMSIFLLSSDKWVNPGSLIEQPNSLLGSTNWVPA